MDTTPTIVVMHGDQTGEEMLLDSLRVLPPGVQLEDYDLSLSARLASENKTVQEASKAIVKHGTSIKAATITESVAGSPNLLIREAIGADVILRTGRLLPGITPQAKVKYPIHIVRMATGEAYGAQETRHGTAMHVGEIAQRIETITRSSCRAVAEYSFILAQRENARVFGGPKWTVSSTFEAMLKEEMDRAARMSPDVEYLPMLIDATYAGVINGRALDKALVIPALNRDGDCLADFVLPLYGSIAGAGSAVVAFDKDYNPVAQMHEAPHGTAPDLEGQNKANPLAMILACASALDDLAFQGHKLSFDGTKVRAAAMQSIKDGIYTGDLGGKASMSEFTDSVISRLAR